MAVTIDDMIRDAGRELGMRKGFYKRQVFAGKMAPATAEHQIACMDAIYALLKRAKEEGWPKP